jgi:hypothetical protein
MAPANGPYIGGTTISTVAVNARFADIEGELTDSLSRSGKGGMTAPVRTANGTVAAPSFAYTAETNTGQYLAAAGDLRLAVGGVDALQLGAGGVSGNLNIVSAGQGNVSATAANSTLALSGNRSAADPNVDVYIQNPNANRTAGYIADFRHAGGDRLLVDYQGLLRLAAQTAALQPASIWTAITPETNIAASRGLGYTKDAVGKIHLRGLITNNTGGNIFAINTTNPLPVGFRPTSRRDFICSSGNAAVGIDVSTAGVLEFFVAFPAGGTVAVDGISFFPEQ